MTNSLKVKRKRSHVKIGDKIKIIAGSQKGIIGNITLVLLKKSLVYIDTLIPRTKYSKKNKEGKSQKIDLQIPIHISNVMLWDKEKNISGRIGYKLLENKKVRYFKKSGNLV